MTRRSRQTCCLLAAALTTLGCADTEPRAPHWQTMQGLEDHGWLISTTASPSGDRWLAVGGTPDHGMVLRESAPEQWTPEAVPEVPLLNWAQVFEDDSSFVVGKAGTILHFDGARWSLQTAPVREDLWGVWGSSPGDVWAVGGAGEREGQATLLHYDGSSWQAVPVPPLQRPNVWAFFKVWGSSASDVYVVGQRGAMLHFDGRTWSELGVGVGEDLIAIYGLSHDRIAVVGGRASGIVATFDGMRWTSKQLAPLPGLNGVWMGDRQTFHVAGIDGTLAEVDFASLAAQPRYQPTPLLFHAIHGAGSRLRAVGGNLGATTSPYLGLARERTLETP
ncbi:MAG: hypothetical protein JWN48_4079 [Myxococcaceae bacterium]|nr:hypothetical protein [Myxococcaceae bacterium]